MIQRDLEEEFRRDDEARIEGTPYLPLGMDCDRRAWDAVRLAYAGDAPPMPERDPPPAVNLARRLRALAAQMDELAGDLMALDEGHWAYGQDLSDWAGIVDEWAAGLATKGQDTTDNTQPLALWLAEEISGIHCHTESEARVIAVAADSLCSQHARIAELEAKIKTMAEEHADELMVAHGRNACRTACAPAGGAGAGGVVRDGMRTVAG